MRARVTAQKCLGTTSFAFDSTLRQRARQCGSDLTDDRQHGRLHDSPGDRAPLQHSSSSADGLREQQIITSTIPGRYEACHMV